jgi:hypothetical protein
VPRGGDFCKKYELLSNEPKQVINIPFRHYGTMKSLGER